MRSSKVSRERIRRHRSPSTRTSASASATTRVRYSLVSRTSGEAKCIDGERSGPLVNSVVLTNAESGLIFYWEVFAAVARAHGWGGFMPGPKTIKPIPPDQIDRFVGVYDIVSGVEMPEMRVWAENGALVTHIEGMRGGPNRPLMDAEGRLFNRTRPSETDVIYGPDGRVAELVVRMFGDAELMRMRRRAP